MNGRRGALLLPELLRRQGRRDRRRRRKRVDREMTGPSLSGGLLNVVVWGVMRVVMGVLLLLLLLLLRRHGVRGGDNECANENQRG
jgi:hypothetical protein